MRLVPMLTCSLSILALACNCADSGTCPPAKEPSNVSVVVAAVDAGSGAITLDKTVSIRIDPQLTTKYHSVSSVSNGVPKNEETYEIGGRKLEFSNRELRIGERSYGAFGDHAQIEIKRDGVFVDGEKRGDLGS